MMIGKNCKLTIQKAANGFIVKLNDNGEPYVFTTEDQVVDWFRSVMSGRDGNPANSPSNKEYDPWEVK